MRWLLIHFADRTAARKLVQRVDQILGYPREHAPSEIVRHGRGPHAPTVYTETALDIRIHDTSGPTILRRAIAIGFDRTVAEAMEERGFDVDGTKRKMREIVVNRGWEVRADLPGDPEAWTRVPPRDGQPWSDTGEPIPEGEE